MPKPSVPAGLIPTDPVPVKISLTTVRNRLKALANDPLLGRVDDAIAQEDWQVAVGLLLVLSNNVLDAHKTVGTLVSRINRKRNSPLFPELDHAGEVGRHDH